MYLGSLSDSDCNILILEILSNIICRQMMTFASIIHLLFVTQASRATFFDGSYCYLQETMQLTSNDPSSYFSTTFSFNSFRNLLIIYQKLVNDYKIQETVYSSRSFIKVQGMEELKGITNAKLLKWVIFETLKYPVMSITCWLSFSFSSKTWKHYWIYTITYLIQGEWYFINTFTTIPN